MLCEQFLFYFMMHQMDFIIITEIIKLGEFAEVIEKNINFMFVIVMKAYMAILIIIFIFIII